MDELIEQYISRYNSLSAYLDQIEETGEIPNADVEGAPETIGEAKMAIASMMWTLDKVIHDLMILRMEQNFATTANEDD